MTNASLSSFAPGEGSLQWQNDESKYGLNLMKKMGYKNGSGLGRNSDGIKKSISIGLKSDNKGVGNDKEQWGFEWWDHVFNKTSSKLDIGKDTSGHVVIKKKEDSSNGNDEKMKQKQLLYGNFVKKKSETDEKKDYRIKVTDKELLEACEGRTCRKGARVDLTQKVVRADAEGVLGKFKKGGMDNNSKSDSSHSVGDIDVSLESKVDAVDPSSKKKKKKSKSKTTKCDNNDTHVDASTKQQPEAPTDTKDLSKKKKKSKSKKVDSGSVTKPVTKDNGDKQSPNTTLYSLDDSGDHQTTSSTVSVKKKKSKSKKERRDAVSDCEKDTVKCAKKRKRSFVQDQESGTSLAVDQNKNNTRKHKKAKKASD